MKAQDVILNGAAGAATAFIGSFVISLIRSPKLLDAERVHQLNQKDSAISRLNEDIASLSKRPYDAALDAVVRQKIQAMTPEAIEALKYILGHGEIETGLIQIPGGVNVFAAANECYQHGLLDRREYRPGNGLVVQTTYYTVKDQFRTVLQDILYPRSS